MSEKPKPTRAQQTSMILGIVASILVFQFMVAPNLDPPEGGGFDFVRVLIAAACGAVGGGLGYAVGRLFKK